MIGQEHVNTVIGREVFDRDGDKIGTVGQVWADGAGQPAWASVRTGLFGLNESLIPLQTAELRGDRVTVPFEKGRVKDAPNVDASADEPLSSEEVADLYRHYDLEWDASQVGRQAGSAAYAGDGSYGDRNYEASAGHDTSGPNTDDAMTRSEERLSVGTERERAGRARLRKYVVTEQQQVTVPVQREEVRLEREPITDANIGKAMDGPAITEEEHEVTLHQERPVVAKETVPVERVRLGKETVTDTETVGGEVRKERIEADLPDRGRRDLS
ncbi:DUF2382 domain-containing protein [Micromonospora terminaliae]|uniref:DUF2382 domain-containing protein n=1 Tax=Micromonospora terminaliae TaxID=1914461 RepID=A0AAJ2ZK51_9ACTN|nr:PRC and DUF2382 domain-containing protein [Micromonospora terminaliae]NES31320.1 PRC and DUF2382 domain-containing protein [Micromonospora terminaliae]QGL49855.1 DUF2382 domain-containing protein [Micromonospora terminaliae]